MIKEFVKSAARSTGYLIKELPVDNHEENLRALFVAADINCVLDVGAHFGEYGRFLRKIGYKNRIVSFEPVKESFELLSRAAAADRDWRVYNVALGRDSATAEIKVSNNSVFTSFLQATDYSREEFGAQQEVARTELVKVATLDSLFKQCLEGIGEPRVFLKLDTQGYDLEVVAGAGASLPQVAGLQSELSVQPIYEAMPDWMGAISAYRALGYEVTGLYPVNRDKNMLVIEFDCVLKRAVRL